MPPAQDNLALSGRRRPCLFNGGSSVLNLYTQKTRPCIPSRCCQKKMGQPNVTKTNKASRPKSGTRKTKARAATLASTIRFTLKYWLEQDAASSEPASPRVVVEPR